MNKIKKIWKKYIWIIFKYNRNTNYLHFVCNILLTETPNIINYQGRLRENGQPVSGNKQMWFNIYDVPTGGTKIWSIDNVTVAVSTGVFNYKLQPTGIDWAKSNTTYYLAVAIDNISSELIPREQFTSVPYAFEANTLSGKTYDAFVSTSTNQTISGVKIFTSSVTVGSSLEVTQADNTKKYSLVVGTATNTGAYHLVVSTNGSVGIGTTEPSTSIEVCRSNTCTW